MSLEYVRRKLQEIRRIRDRILDESNSDQELKAFGPDRKFKKVSEYKVAAIMDEFTYQAFKPEFNLLQLTPGKWEEELRNFQPDFLFLESAWLGAGGSWNTKLSNLSEEIIEVIGYCKLNNIPVAFWNKEDPIHYQTFIALAKLVDIVFTTDIDCVSKYMSVLKHERVYLLPFAAQTKLHNPIEMFERENKFCFAGAYYRRFSERRNDLESIINTVTKESEVVIYDRNYHKHDPNYRFPRKYKKYIAGYLKPDEIAKAYKGYRYNINLNTVKYSQTMCARRIFELLASNTVIISNYSRAVRNLFGDLIICTDDSKQLEVHLKLLKDEEYYRKLRLAGLRKVLTEHTYSQRARYLVSKIYGQKYDSCEARVAVISTVGSMEEMERIIASFYRQNYINRKLFIVSAINVDKLPDDVKLVHNFDREWINQLRSDFDYIAFFSCKDYYGPNYIYDFMTVREYAEAAVLTKSAFFISDKGKIKKCNEDNVYTFVDGAKIRRSVMKCDAIYDELLLSWIQSMDEAFLETVCFSIDEYNYCMNFTDGECPPVDDLKITDTGVSINQIYLKAEQIHAGCTTDLEQALENFKTVADNICVINKSNILLCTDRYPTYDALYQYPFVHNRVAEYRINGLMVDVFVCNEQAVKGFYEFCGVDIMTGYYKELIAALTYGDYDTILIHFFSETLWQGIKNSVEGKRIIIWIHGAEIQPWWRRIFNYQTKDELETAKKLSDRRLAFWKEIFQLAMNSDTYHFHFVFVSNYLAETVFEDLEIELPQEKYSVIHNFINTDLFAYQSKPLEQRKKILSIRPFASPTYANDLTVKAILELSKEKFFKELEFRIIGQGKLLNSTVKPIRKFRNVIIENRFVRQEEIAILHKEYGVFLVPSRMDTQGVSRDEAMSSGLVPVTNSVAAIPEFVDQSSGILAEPEDFKGLAEGIKRLYYEPGLFTTLSRNAADLIRKHRGTTQTIHKEIELILSGKEVS